MKTTTTLKFIICASFVAGMKAAGDSSNEQQCNGVPPQESMVHYLGMNLDYETADRICCHNHRYAEPRGYLEWEPDVALFDRLEEQNLTNETIFYDVVCGLPLFIAPRGRSYDDFKKESIKHGWPSFRPEEIISENVIIHPDGRMESKCLTHLGHNLPEGGVDRYCIDLVCIAGSPLAVSNDELTQQFPSLSLLSTTAETAAATVEKEAEKAPQEQTESTNTDEEDVETTAEDNNNGTTETKEEDDAEDVAMMEEEDDVSTPNFVTSENLDPNTYESSAALNSGNVSNKKRNVTIGVVVAVVVVALLIAVYFFFLKDTKKEKESSAKKTNDDDEKTNDDEMASSSSSNTPASADEIP